MSLKMDESPRVDDEKHPIEAKESWELHTERVVMGVVGNDGNSLAGDSGTFRRRLNRHIKETKRKKKLEDLWYDPGIKIDTMHGMMIDAGSSGSRMHIYEFQPRILEGKREIAQAVSGRKLSYPGTVSRWTDRLHPGIATFASLPDDQLFDVIANYLQPLIGFAETVLHSKNDTFSEYPVYLKGTAGLRTLDAHNRSRVLNACRAFFRNETHNKFMFEKEFARVISGEEEAVYGWTGVNFALGSLLASSEGSGTVMDPGKTYGTLEIGGASAQIAFYRSNEDIMSNLFKLQIGQGKHWNIYAHSFLYYGVNEAWNRMGALLSTGESSKVISPPYNPCLAGGSEIDFESKIYFVDGRESFKNDELGNSLSYNVVLQNNESKGNYEECALIANSLLNKRYNEWCDFSHHGDCSFSGIYQPELPRVDESSAEFYAFSEYFEVFDFLGIPGTSSLTTLQNATKVLCSMDHHELNQFNGGRLDDSHALKMCFRSTFALEMLLGFGLQMDDNITAANVINGQKIGWALGSMLYEINTLPWKYAPKKWHQKYDVDDGLAIVGFVGIMTSSAILGALIAFVVSRRGRWGYSKVYDVQMINGKIVK